MPGYTPIKWRKTDVENLRKQVKRFNAKIDRLKKKDPENADKLPARLYVKELRETIDTRKDYNRLMQGIDRFFKKGAEKLVKKGEYTRTAWEWKEQQLAVRRINAMRARVRQELNAEGARGRGTESAILGLNLTPARTDLSNTYIKDWDSYMRGLRRMQATSYYYHADEQLKRNWLKGAYVELGDGYGTILYNMLRHVPAHQFAWWIVNEPLMTIDYVYGAEGAAAKFESLSLVLKKYGYEVPYGEFTTIPYDTLFDDNDPESVKMLKQV